MLLVQVMLLCISSISASAVNLPSRSQDIVVAMEEMQRANYFTFVTLINMAPPDLFQSNITFLMPNDRILSGTNIPETTLVDLLLRQSIPSPLLFEHLEHFPTGSMIPTSRPGYVFKVDNDGRERFYLNNVRIVSPNVCTKGSSIRCHGVDGVVQPTSLPLQPNTQPLLSCPNSTVVPPVRSAPPPPFPVVMVLAPPPSAPSSSFSKTCNGRSSVHLLMALLMMIYLVACRV
ncbi:hypothetical protein F511_14480 [Dorcoceras hygrometricum]|uniref:FAS1 domain-containing protein n=1 Tax=Dorcoceras hygrometricum TaxID=472368 RepID=A0A2Z7CF04_9LAMI|nr:hypothetical protein F511_14480 [Dorcoceras hygrometricum]